MHIKKLLSSEDLAKWDKFVENHPHGSIYHTEGWKHALEKNFKHIHGSIFAVFDDSSTHILAGMPIYLVKSRLTGKRLVSIPFALHGTPLLSSTDEITILIKKILSVYHSANIAYIEIRSWLPIEKKIDAQFGKSENYNCHYLSLHGDLEDIKKQFHKKAVRVPIRKSLKNGLELKIGEDENDLKIYYRISFVSRKRLGLPIMPYGFTKTLWREFKPKNQIMILIAKHAGKAVGAAMLFMFNNIATVEYGYDLITHRKLFVNQFLDWNSIKIAHNKGNKYFCFGRTSINHEGLMTYKNRWATCSKTIPIYFYPWTAADIDQPNEASLKYRVARKVHKIAPDPLYRMLSEMAYRHLG